MTLPRDSDGYDVEALWFYGLWGVLLVGSALALMFCVWMYVCISADLRELRAARAARESAPRGPAS